MRPPLNPTGTEHAALDHMQNVAPEIGTACALAQDFIELMREHVAERLKIRIE